MRNVLVVGGSSSIGQDVKKVFIRNGDKVFSTYFSSTQENKKKEITAIRLDLNSGTTYSVLKEVFQKKSLDVVIILSGILPGLSIEDYPIKIIEEVMNINFLSNAYIIKSLLPYLNEDSNIVIMSSISGIKGSYDPIYAASKAAQIGMVKSLSQWNKDKYKINAIAPSLINESSMYYDMAEERRELHKANSPTKKLISKSQISDLIFDICQPNSEYANGEIIEIFGGPSRKNQKR